MDIFFGNNQKYDITSRHPCRRAGLDSVAQLVEHDTFNVGVLGSSPSGITFIGSGDFVCLNVLLVAVILIFPLKI